jgi:hypothetical protein
MQPPISAGAPASTQIAVTGLARRISGSTLWTGLGLFAAFWLVMALVQFASPSLPDNDGYYHIKMASLMRAEGLRPAFPWLPLTVLNPQEYYNHHFLFHVALIPFTFIDLRLGAKLAAVTFSALAFLSVWWLLRGQRVPYAALWALGLLAVSEAFLYRMSITRAQSLSLAVLALALHWMLTGKYRRLLPLGFFYVWFYNAFPLILMLAGVYIAAVLLSERRLELRPLGYAGPGVLLGNLINPYFPANLVFALRHYLPKLTEPTAVSVGSEWYPYDTVQLMQNSPLALLAFLGGALALGLAGQKLTTRSAAAFLAAAMFGAMLFQSRRFIEYFPPFALIFAAFAAAPLIEQLKAFSKAQGAALGTLRRRLLAQAAPAGLVILLAIGLVLTLPRAQGSLRTSKPYQTYARASAWLAANTQPGERVFQTDWDDFPRLFFYNSDNTYLIGLDPTYMQLYDAGLYDQWVDITQGEVERPSQEIRTTFGSGYVITDLRHSAFIRAAGKDPGLQQVYRDAYAIIYRVKP